MKVLLSSLCLALVVYTIVEVDVVDGYPHQSVDLERLRELLEERRLGGSNDEDSYERREAPALGPSNEQVDAYPAEESLAADQELEEREQPIEEVRDYLDPQGEIADEADLDDSALQEPEDRFFSEDSFDADSVEVNPDELRELDDDQQELYDEDLAQPQYRAYVDEANSDMEEYDGFNAAARSAWPDKEIDDTVALDDFEARSADADQSAASKPKDTPVKTKPAPDKSSSSRREKLKKLYAQKVTQAQRYDGVLDFGILGKLKISGVVVTLSDDRQFFIRRRFRLFGGRRWGATSISSASKMKENFWKSSGTPKKVETSKVVDYVRACQRTRSTAAAAKKMMSLG